MQRCYFAFIACLSVYRYLGAFKTSSPVSIAILSLTRPQGKQIKILLFLVCFFVKDLIFLLFRNVLMVYQDSELKLILFKNISFRSWAKMQGVYRPKLVILYDVCGKPKIIQVLSCGYRRNLTFKQTYICLNPVLIFHLSKRHK